MRQDANAIYYNVIIQLLPVTTVEKHTVGDGKVGTMTKEMQKKFGEFIKNECRMSMSDKVIT